MAEQAGQGNGQGASPRRGPGLPGDVPGPAGLDPRLSGFAPGGERDGCPPTVSPPASLALTLAAAVEAASGPGWRCDGVSREEMFRLLKQWQALESRAAAGKLAVLRALIRDDDEPLPGGGYHGDLPDGWTKSLTHEVALALSMPAVSAEQLMWLAWDLEVRLPGTAGLLAAGQLTVAKAKAVDEALAPLSDQDAAAAEAMILADLPGKTHGQVAKLAAAAAVTVDPDSAVRRRKEAERTRSRVEMFREQSGAAALSGRELPTDQTLAADASVRARALEYQESGAFPDGTPADRYRAAAYLDLLNGISAGDRIAAGLLPGDGPGERDDTDEPDTGEPGDTGERVGGSGCPCGECDGSCLPPDDDPGDDDPDDDGDDGDDGGDSDDDSDDDDSDANPDDGGGGPDGGTPGGGRGNGGDPDGGVLRDEGRGGGPGNGGGPREEPGGRPGEDAGGGLPSGSPGRAPRLADLVLPLATLLGLAERPGEGHRLGPLDPDLCRALALSAVGSPYSKLCVTVTDPDGFAIGHGCGRTARRGRNAAGPTSARRGPSRGSLALPARVNLTVSAERLAELAGATGPPGRGLWGFGRGSDSGPPGGYGGWTLTLPDGGDLTVELRPVPTFDCDHQYESHAYQPNATLRHLVQVRDWECTFPSCSRHARESDFEHATPYDKGGRTCACNAGARSRACHQVKQSAGWLVTQPKPGWHQWKTPSGSTYIQGPKRYPA